MKVKEIKNIPYLIICLCVAFGMTGGFFDHSVAVIGVAIIGCMFTMLVNGADFYERDKRIIFLIPVMLVCVAVVVSFWAVDYMENFMGIMRLAVVCLWIYLVRSSRKTDVLLTKKILPFMGFLSVIISLASYYIPALMPYFWENRRMSGFFQYANTNGLFFSVGIMLLIYRIGEQKLNRLEWVELLSLVAGLLLTGSRSVLLLLLVFSILYAVRTKEFRKILVLGSGIFLGFSSIYVLVTGNVNNIGRIFTIFSSNSTLWGRLLYYRDAILLLLGKCFGLGRLGYYYSQGTFQSGIYRIKFVHNDFLQIALDYGWIALILLLVFLGWQIIKGTQSKEEKGILLFICVASLVDFHCQYLFIVMILCLFFDYGECVKEKKNQRKENYFMLPVWGVLFLYIAIATGSSKMGNQTLALSMLPDYTNAQEKIILEKGGTVEAYEIANSLIEKNPYNLTAYVVRGYFYGSRLCVEECIADLDRTLELDPYNTSYYAQYEVLLENMEDAIQASGIQEDSKEWLELLRQRKTTLKTQLEEVEERTSFLAYKIKDKPVFTYK